MNFYFSHFFINKMLVSLSISSALLPLFFVLLAFMTSHIAVNSAVISCPSVNKLLSICLYNSLYDSSIHFISNLSFLIVHMLYSTIHVDTTSVIYRNDMSTLIIINRHLPLKIPKARSTHIRVEL